MLQAALTWIQDHPVLASFAACPLLAAAAVPLLLARRRQIAWEKRLCGAALALLLAWSLWSLGSGTYWPGTWWDLQSFHKAGLAIRAGDNPYAPRENPATPLIQHPPTSFPLFALVAWQPFPTAGRLWLLLSLGALLLLVPLVRKNGVSLTEHARVEVFPWAVQACSIFSFAAIFEMLAGQMSLWASVLLYGTLWCRRRGYRVGAGLSLALATVKPATVLPFLLLFVRRRDWVTWTTLAATCLGLCLLTTPAGELPNRLLQNAQVISQLRQAGGEDDYSFEAPLSHFGINFSRWLYCLGLRDRTLIMVLQLLILAALAGWLWWELYRRPNRLPPGAGEALTCLLASVCLSHKLYDMVILALPLLYCTQQCRRHTGWRRLGFAATVLGLLGALNMPGKLLETIATWSHGAGVWGWMAQAIVLPYTVWVVLLAMAMIGVGSFPQTPRREGEAPAGLDYAGR